MQFYFGLSYLCTSAGLHLKDRLVSSSGLYKAVIFSFFYKKKFIVERVRLNFESLYVILQFFLVEVHCCNNFFRIKFFNDFNFVYLKPLCYFLACNFIAAVFINHKNFIIAVKFAQQQSFFLSIEPSESFIKPELSFVKS